MTTKYTLAWCTTTAAIVTTIMNKKQSVCFSFLRKKKNEIIPKEKIEEKKLKITTRFQYLFLSDEEEYFSAMTAHKKHWKIVYLFCCLCRPFSILDDTSLPEEKTQHPKTHTNYTYNVYTHRLKRILIFCASMYHHIGIIKPHRVKQPERKYIQIWTLWLIVLLTPGKSNHPKNTDIDL